MTRLRLRAISGARLLFRSVVLAGALCAGASEAAVTSYTSKAGFDAAIAGLSARQTVDFDAVASGTAFASGSGTGGLTFSYAIAGPSTLQVADSFGTTSGSHYLGLDNPDTAFYLGDSFTINFNRSVHAAGLYLIAGGDTQAGDLAMSVPGHTVFNAATPDALVSDGNAYYLGLVDSGAGFSSVTVYGVPSAGAFLAFTADDITSAVPEPASAWLLLAGLATLLPLQRRRSR